jgi:large subunit ribosomal protein L4e
MTSRPVVSVYSRDTQSEIVDSVSIPAVFTAPIRDDIVHFVHTNINKNRRQAHGVKFEAGFGHSAESWGTGRAVARIPRISGSGTSRAGQGAFGNMCRKGGMYAPLKTWRRWHRKVNLKQKRHAVASALAASAVTPLVLARGHRIQEVPELPLVLDNLNAETTKTLLSTLKKFGVGEELQRTRDSRKIRQGVGKMRNSRYVLRKGPLIIYGDENNLVKRTARNLPGVDTCNVHRLNLLQLAPGGHLGRFIIWTKDAFKALNKIFGNYRAKGVEKGGYVLNRNLLTVADLSRLINSDQVQSKVRAIRKSVVAHDRQKRNPLQNRALMHKLNPHDTVRRAADLKLQKERNSKRAETIKAKRSPSAKKAKKDRKTKHTNLANGLVKSYQDALNVLQKEEDLGVMAKKDADEESDDE